MATSAGDLTERVAFRYYDQDAGEWVTRCEVWAKVRYVGGAIEDVLTGHALQRLAYGYEVTIRRRGDIGERDVIVWQGHALGITAIERASPRDRCLTIQADMGEGNPGALEDADG